MKIEFPYFMFNGTFITKIIVDKVDINDVRKTAKYRVVNNRNLEIDKSCILKKDHNIILDKIEKFVNLEK